MTKEKQSSPLKQPQEAVADILPDWMTFPVLASVFDPSPLEAIAYLTAKQKEYQTQLASAIAADRVRARLIAESYARTSALLQELEERRQGILRKEATKAAEPR